MKLVSQLVFLYFRSNRREIQDSHERIEKRVVESHNLLAESSTDNGRLLDSISERLDTSQARIESQLQAILANQQKSKTPILSQSLDASSPEGRQTWMELGRLLRDEGITPDMIQDNRGLLIDAMKNTLRNKTVLAESASESYATAPEHPSHSITPLSASRQRDRQEGSHFGNTNALHSQIFQGNFYGLTISWTHSPIRTEHKLIMLRSHGCCPSRP